MIKNVTTGVKLSGLNDYTMVFPAMNFHNTDYTKMCTILKNIWTSPKVYNRFTVVKAVLIF